MIRLFAVASLLLGCEGPTACNERIQPAKGNGGCTSSLIVSGCHPLARPTIEGNALRCRCPDVAKEAKP